MERGRTDRDRERKHAIKTTRPSKMCILATAELYTDIAERGTVGVPLPPGKHEEFLD